MDSGPRGRPRRQFRPFEVLGTARDFGKRFAPEERDQQRE